MSDMRTRIDGLAGKTFAGVKVVSADEFSYLDPVDGSVSNNQGLWIFFEGQRRAVLRLSETGTDGSTLRVYLEQYAKQNADQTIDTQEVLESVRRATIEVCQMEKHIGRTRPDVMT